MSSGAVLAPRFLAAVALVFALAAGVAADAQGNIYGAEVGPRQLKKVILGTAALPRTMP